MKKTIKKVVLLIAAGLILQIAAGLYGVSKWYQSTFDMEFQELLLTLQSPLKGVSSITVRSVVDACLPTMLISLGCFLVLAVLTFARRALLRRILCGACALSLVLSGWYAFSAFRLSRYLTLRSQQTHIYEDYYVDPATVAIEATGEKKNLICIYLESMETTYASAADGGAQPDANYIRGLTQLARDNISFSDKEALGGFYNPSGTAWTMGALVATTSGIPITVAVTGEGSENSLNAREEVFGGLTTLGDILEEQGYTQEFLCGSDGHFAGRKEYFESHGNYYVYDLAVARENGDLPSEDYWDNWWGFEDFRLYDIAKVELTKLAQSDEPFNFTMLTVDTHHVGGHRCEKCSGVHSGLAQVLCCADSLVTEFVAWIMEQDFYEDTVVVISGDHPRMDTILTVDTDPNYDRTIYNCFLNTGLDESKLNLTNRTFASLDMFPTILSALGFSIEGDRLGLGTNLFSDLPTLSEQLGRDYVNDELAKYSEYYLAKFL